MDRLRRLDALFAEKVLGCEIYTMPYQDLLSGEPVREPMIQRGDQHLGGLPLYTRSLDAAWAGMNESCSSWALYRRDQRPRPERYDYIAEIHRGPDTFTGSGSHPAEALVLACLRAVGVPEEELQEASHAE